MNIDNFTPKQIEEAKEVIQKKEFIIPLPKTSNEIPPVLYVFRHGQSEDNSNFIFSGWRDSKLTELGRNQAEILSEKLKDEHFDLAITSKLVRAKETLDIVLKHHRNAKVEIDDRIIERSYGDLQGSSKIELYLKDPVTEEKYRRDYDFPANNGESLKMVEKRVKSFLNSLLPRMKAEKINVVVSCHSNSMRALRKILENLTVEEMCKLENPLGQDFASYEIK
ncbi:hypothetical protein A2716_03490 [candidate division WWE3 bacterium RIFCSPHIGHO2_01_FULL_40_23]|uniref:phosphoglycerate mutase (2,3-diphosphoglycerate-dependent) n=1 Tax=candidate division WWE3 bacterium RIFCSPLOWO2_01_FULL_41_18 TaxID=1802625 RepID=A0A1F4VE16_UNCKA|nr:MAG: hypothetical protein A2716_03490 [candidate division WWE3 bacterium RIFCSPHIGHO2_01_FULL_40_23]OGC54943.1 MAG: hypothetical protein A3A78_03100 [candidate division WWE3 bacterium RIFCSPLOWO2_01_FULL_41_18]